MSISEKFLKDRFEVLKEKQGEDLQRWHEQRMEFEKDEMKNGTAMAVATRAEIVRLKDNGKNLYDRKQIAKAQEEYLRALVLANGLVDYGIETTTDRGIRAKICFNMAVFARREQQWEMVWTWTQDALKIDPAYSKAKKMQDLAMEEMKVSKRLLQKK